MLVASSVRLFQRGGQVKDSESHCGLCRIGHGFANSVVDTVQCFCRRSDFSVS